MQTLIHKADSRGVAEHGWLSSRHTFSFGEYRDPERVRFGLLRVINDDVVEPSMGFGTHPHDNMEIVSIPLSGELRHEDSMGNVQRIRAGEVQLMSAGTGLTHSEYNGSDAELANFLQIWVFPKERDIEPRYDQKLFAPADRQGRLQNVVAPMGTEGVVNINQAAWFWLGNYASEDTGSYQLQTPGHGIYVFVIEGGLEIAGEVLERRDGMAISDADEVEFTATADTELLVMEVPLS